MNKLLSAAALALLMTAPPFAQALPNTVCRPSLTPVTGSTVCASGSWWLEYHTCGWAGPDTWRCYWIVTTSRLAGWSDSHLPGQMKYDGWGDEPYIYVPDDTACAWPSTITIDPNALLSSGCSIGGITFYYEKTWRPWDSCRNSGAGFTVNANVFVSQAEVQHDLSYRACYGQVGTFEYFR